MSRVKIYFLLSVTLSRAEAQLCTWHICFDTRSSFSAFLFDISTVLDNLWLLWQSGPAWSPWRIIVHSRPAHKPGDGTLGFPISVCPQICPA